MESIRRFLWSGLEIICSYGYPKADTTLSHGSVFQPLLSELGNVWLRYPKRYPN